MSRKKQVADQDEFITQAEQEMEMDRSVMQKETPYQDQAELRNRQIFEYLPFVKQTVQRIASHLPKSVEIDDLISAGTIGLIQAMERYDPSRGIQLKTYAAFRIKGAVLSELRSRDILSRSSRKKVRELEKAQIELEHELGREARDKELAQRLNVEMDELNKIRSIGSFSIVSIDEVVGHNENARDSLLSYLSDDNVDDPLALAGLKELKAALAEGIEQLPEKEKLVVSLYYAEELTMREVGNVLNVTESRVSQLHSQAVRRLRNHLRKEGLIDSP
jgi:RNA polymerase sigma factor FliA